MNKSQTILRTLFLHTPSIKAVALDEKFNVSANLINLLLGLIYGSISILYNFEYIASFKTPLLRILFVPLFFITFSIIMIYLTRVGYTLLLWAGSRALGGPGILRTLNRISGIILLPSILAFPGLVNLTINQSLLTWELLGIILSLIWIYFLSAKALMLSQQLTSLKAYIAIIMIFVFFSSVYYMILPPTS
ncbi:hypothetical protein [Bacillus solimangrovi]|uniref:Yip1 domain-containing protein n=1 Tax=Bacillus solimangrovi TaxID=1305675 RepID=A0A1E5LCZ1_9BACI|nr:hypothetical protein [Bacillus solimangrovi]OEH91909.1 hypothetical protein BFG57_04025 [Bacillus solimangrovi]